MKLVRHTHTLTHRDTYTSEDKIIDLSQACERLNEIHQIESRKPHRKVIIMKNMKREKATEHTKYALCVCNGMQCNSYSFAIPKIETE